MVVCICRNVSDRAISRMVAEGSESLDEVTARCGAGGDCGSCRGTVARLVAEAVRERGSSIAFGDTAA
jgi:bacterioferritin-associated ferredoxin